MSLSCTRAGTPAVRRLINLRCINAADPQKHDKKSKTHFCTFCAMPALLQNNLVRVRSASVVGISAQGSKQDGATGGTRRAT